MSGFNAEKWRAELAAACVLAGEKLMPTGEYPNGIEVFEFVAACWPIIERAYAEGRNNGGRYWSTVAYETAIKLVHSEQWRVRGREEFFDPPRVVERLAALAAARKGEGT